MNVNRKYPFYVIGSTVLERHGLAKAKDFDIVVPERLQDTEGEQIVCPPLYFYLESQEKASNMISLDELYTLKLSHSFFDVHWRKTLRHIKLLQEQRCRLIYPLYDELYAYWEGYHGKSYKEFGKEESFFEDAVERDYDHDWLHRQISPNPAYRMIRKNDGTAMVCKKLWNSLSIQHKMQVVLEEAYVLCFERFMHLNESTTTKIGYAMKLLCINLGPKFISEFIVLNYYTLIGSINYKFVNKIWDKIRK